MHYPPKSDFCNKHNESMRKNRSISAYRCQSNLIRSINFTIKFLPEGLFLTTGGTAGYGFYFISFLGKICLLQTCFTLPLSLSPLVSATRPTGSGMALQTPEQRLNNLNQSRSESKALV